MVGGLRGLVSRKSIEGRGECIIEDNHGRLDGRDLDGGFNGLVGGSVFCEGKSNGDGGEGNWVVLDE